MLIEVGLMLEWYLPDKGVTVADEVFADFLRLWSELFDKLATTRRTWMLRDFHSPNLIWLGQRRDISRVGILDFQDAVLGPPAYDLVSLLQDARIDVPEDIEIPMLAHYARKRRTADPDFHPAAFAEEYAIMSAQRNTRLLGTFARPEPTRQQTAVPEAPAEGLDLPQPRARTPKSGGVPRLVHGACPATGSLTKIPAV